MDSIDPRGGVPRCSITQDIFLVRVNDLAGAIKN